MYSTEPQTWLAIFMAALATYSLRTGGLLLGDRLPQKGRVSKALEALPGTILISLVTPSIFAEGPWGVAAACSTALVTYKSNNVFAGMVVGVAIVALQRNLGL
jgi:uncharacterized membrane protein